MSGKRNAYMEIIRIGDDATFWPITCQHGGSEWLCAECAETLVKENNPNFLIRSGSHTHRQSQMFTIILPTQGEGENYEGS